MALKTILCDLAADTQGNATAVLLDGGRCDVYDGDQPDDGAEGVTTQVLCFSIGFGTPAFLPSKGGVLVANPMRGGLVTCDVPPSGVPRLARWFCAYTLAGEPVFLGSVGTKDANMIIGSALMVPNTMVNPSSFTHVIPKSLPGA
jgi:hypothetical protein